MKGVGAARASTTGRAATELTNPQPSLPAFSELLEALGISQGDRIAVANRPTPDAAWRSWIVPADEAAEFAAGLGGDVWYSPCPTTATTGRGGVADVARVPALWLDLDTKPEGLGSLENCRTLIDNLSMVGAPIAFVATGGGLHPYWKIAGGHDTALAAGVLRRFELLARTVAAELRLGQLDTVSDLARCLRVPGSRNHKYDPPRLTTLEIREDGDTLDLAEIDQKLTDLGVPRTLGADPSGAREVVADPQSWAWAEPGARCAYADRMVAGWRSDVPKSGRHPWLVAQSVRLAASHRHGCLDEAQHSRALEVLAGRFRQLCEGGLGGPVRAVAAAEISSATLWASELVARKTDAAVSAELGGHARHEPASGPLGGVGAELQRPDTATTAGAGVGGPSAEQTAPGGGVEPDTRPPRRVRLTPASDIRTERASWLWQGRVARGALSILAGREGLGKSTLALQIVADATLGELPGEFHGQPSNTLISAAEDSWSHVIVPRLIAAGADLKRVFRADVARPDGAELGDMVFPNDVGELDHAIRSTGAVLLVIDPLISRTSSKLDTHRDSDVRAAFEPLTRTLAETGCAAIALLHFNKGSGSDVGDRIMGSRAFAALARSVLAVQLDPEDETVRLLGLSKSNYGRLDLPQRRFRIVTAQVPVDSGGSSESSRIEWLGEDPRSVKDVLTASSETDSGEKIALDEATAWLARYLSDSGGQAFSGEVKDAARRDGHSERTVARARQSLRLEATTTAARTGRRTVWSLPGTALPTEPTGGVVPRAGGALGTMARPPSGEAC